jgi:hypothetical protein
MLRRFTLARSWGAPVRIEIALTAVANNRFGVASHFLGEPFLLYFVAVEASASILDRTAGFAALVGTSTGAPCCIITVLPTRPVRQSTCPAMMISL